MTNEFLHIRKTISSEGGRIIGLDLLRISLAVLIYMFHSWMHFGCRYSYLNDFVSVGAIAMTGFFLLSGYALRLVYGEKDLMEKHNLVKFYFKRILGVIPLYYFFAFLYIFLIGKETLVDNVLLFPIEVLGLQTTFSSLFEVSHNGGTWFISCIILAYLIYPFLQTVCKQLKAKHKALLFLLLLFLDVWGAVISHKFHTAEIYDNPFYRIVEFASGMLVADINIEYDNKLLKILRSWVMLICSVLVLIVGVSLMRNYLHYEDYMLYNIIAVPCFVTMLFALGTLKMPLLEKSHIIAYLGKISYAFFLVQFFAWKAGKWTLYFLGYDTNIIRIIVTFSYCVIASIVVYEFVQKPIVKFLKIKIYNI